MKIGRIALLLLLLLLPARAQDPRTEVLGAMVPLGAALFTDQPDLALQLIDELHQKPVPSDLDLELCLVGLEASREAGLPARQREFLEAARKLAPAASGTAALSARFLVDTYAYDLLRRQDPERARAQLSESLATALGPLEKTPPDADELKRWSVLHWMYGRAFGIWLEALVRDSDENPEATRRGLERTLALGTRLGQEWGPDLWMGFLEARIQTLDRLSAQDPLRSLLQPDLAQLDPRAAGPALARLQLSEVRRIVRATPDRLDAQSSARVRSLLESATAVVRTRASLALANDLYRTTLMALFKSSKSGWQDAADRVLTQLPPSVEASRPDLINALTYRARLRELQGRKPEALADAQRAVDLLEQTLRETGGSPAAAEALRSEARETYDLLTRLQLGAGKATEAFATASRYQQLESASLFERGDLARQSGDEGGRLAALERQGKATPEIRQKALETYEQLTRANPGLNRLSLHGADLSQLQSALPEGTALVQLLPGESELLIFVVRRSGLEVRRSPVGREQLEAQVTAARRAIQARGPAQAELSVLYGSTLKPVEPLLQDVKTVVLAPSGILLYVPWAALRTPDGYLVQAHPLALVTRSSELQRVLGESASAHQSLVALGNPDGSLPGASEEARALSSLFPGSRVLLGPEASRAALSGPGDLLHLATHGVINTREPRDSYLVLAGGDKLRVSEVVAMPPHPRSLTTLSACQTALGERIPGAQLRSLAEAFSLAGAQSVLASLWKIPDLPTRDLMVRFYRELASGKTKAEALREAQLGLIQSPDNALPFNWAAFVLIGDFR